MTSMLPVVGSADIPLERARLDELGFAWWEAHLLDEHNNGVVLWWGFGLPEARLHDAGVPASAVPSLSLLVVAQGAPAFWLHQRYSASDAAWEAPAGRWRFGRSQIETLRDLRAQVVIARIDCALPGTRQRLVGHVEMGGVPRRTSSSPQGNDDEWAPLMGPGEGRAILSVGDAARFHLQGRASHQRHGRALALDDGGWFCWGTAPFPDHTRSFQLRRRATGELEATGVTVDAEGRGETVPDLDVELEGALAGWRRLTLRRGAEPWLQLQRERPLLTREIATTSFASCRAPLALPVSGVVQELDTSGLLDQRRRERARDFLHHAGESNPLRVRFTTGTRHRRWRRAFPFG